MARQDFKRRCFDLIDFLKHVLNLVLLEREINFGRLNIFLTQKHGFIFLPFEFWVVYNSTINSGFENCIPHGGM